MGILDNVNAQVNQNNVTRMPNGRRNNMQDAPKAKVWLNIGYELNGKFVNLPVGIPVDTMEPVRVNGQEDWANFQAARNELLKALQQTGDELEPGAALELPMLKIQIRHVNEEITPDSSTNPYSMSVSSILDGAIVKPKQVNQE